MAIFCLGFNTFSLFSRRIFKIDDAPVFASLIFWFCFAEMICSVPRNSPMGDYQNIWLTGEHSEPIGTIRTLAYGPTQKSPPSVLVSFAAVIRVVTQRSSPLRPCRRFFKLLLPQSPRGFSAFARLYYLARPTITAMLRRLRSHLRASLRTSDREATTGNASAVCRLPTREIAKKKKTCVCWSKLSLCGRRKKGKERGREKSTPLPFSLFPFFPIPYSFRRLLRRLSKLQFWPRSRFTLYHELLSRV